MNQINRQNSFHESIGMCALCVPLDLVLFLLIMNICFFVPRQVPSWAAKLRSCTLKLRGSSECLQVEWVPSITNHRYTGMSLGPETFQTQKNIHGSILVPWSSDFCQVSKSPLIPKSPPFWSPLPLLWCPNDLSVFNLSQGSLSVVDNIWNGLITVLSCPDRSVAWAGYRQSLAFTLFSFGF